MEIVAPTRLNEHCWFFAVSSGIGREGNPKAEIRNPKEDRSPKSEPVHLPQKRQSGRRSLSACYRGRVGLREARKKPELSRSSLIQTHSLWGEELASLKGLISGFGLRISFGFRASDFGLCHKSVSTQNSEEPHCSSLTAFQAILRAALP
jgi:hypothetical protein